MGGTSLADSDARDMERRETDNHFKNNGKGKEKGEGKGKGKGKGNDEDVNLDNGRPKIVMEAWSEGSSTDGENAENSVDAESKFPDQVPGGISDDTNEGDGEGGEGSDGLSMAQLGNNRDGVNGETYQKVGRKAGDEDDGEAKSRALIDSADHENPRQQGDGSGPSTENIERTKEVSVTRRLFLVKVPMDDPMKVELCRQMLQAASFWRRITERVPASNSTPPLPPPPLRLDRVLVQKSPNQRTITLKLVVVRDEEPHPSEAAKEEQTTRPSTPRDTADAEVNLKLEVTGKSKITTQVRFSP